MREDFFKELRKKAQDNNLNVEELINKYSNYYNLGVEAGLSEEDILNRFGSIDDIILSMKYCNKREVLKRKLKKFSIEAAGLEELIIESVPGDNIRVLYSSEDVKRNYRVEETNDTFKLIVKERINNTKKIKFEGKIRIEVGLDIDISCIKLELVNNLNDLSNFSLNTLDLKVECVIGELIANNIAFNNANIETVSSDIKFDGVMGDSLSIDNVSGEVQMNRVTLDRFNADNVSGHININGKVSSYKAESISGSIYLNGQKINKSIGDIIKNVLRGRN